MSRCFPFPPLGYERKAKPSDGANLIHKEKHKEKTHKKDKKDKEKKERKAREDKESISKERKAREDKESISKERKTREDKESISKERKVREDKESISKNHEGKKDRKHKDKEKNKNRDKEEKRASEEKKIAYSLDHQNSTKLGPSLNQTQDSSFLLELEKRVWNDNGARDVQNADKICVSTGNSKPTGKVLESNSILVEGFRKFMEEREESGMLNGYRIKRNAMHMENGFVCHDLEKETKNVGESVWQVEIASERQKEQKDNIKHANKDGRGDRHKDRDREKKSKSKDKKLEKEKAKEEKLKEVSSLVQSKLLENGNTSVYIANDRESNVSKESNGKNGILGKRKEPLMNGSLHGNDTLTKIHRPVSEVAENRSRINALNGAVQSSQESDHAVQKFKLNNKVSASNVVVANASVSEKMSQTTKNFAVKRQEGANSFHKARDSNCFNAGDIGRKLEPCEIAVNSADVDHGVLTNHSMKKKFSLVVPITENGINSHSGQSNSLTTAEKQGTVCKFKLENTESMIDGLVGSNTKSLGHASAHVPRQLKDTDKTNVKPPHPDSKYLSQILSVPKLDWSDIIEQEWLFTSEDRRSKNPKIDPETCEEKKQVWAKTLQLESADVTALPYVIPY